MYALCGIEPDLAVAVSYYSRFQNSAAQKEWTSIEPTSLQAQPG